MWIMARCFSVFCSLTTQSGPVVEGAAAPAAGPAPRGHWTTETPRHCLKGITVEKCRFSRDTLGAPEVSLFEADMQINHGISAHRKQ